MGLRGCYAAYLLRGACSLGGCDVYPVFLGCTWALELSLASLAWSPPRSLTALGIFLECLYHILGAVAYGLAVAGNLRDGHQGCRVVVMELINNIAKAGQGTFTIFT